MSLPPSLPLMCFSPLWLLFAGGEAVDEQAQQEEVEEKLKECIDNVMDKRWDAHSMRRLRSNVVPNRDSRTFKL